MDYIVPKRRNEYKCSCLLFDDIKLGKLKALTADYVLSEVTGNLKSEREATKGTSNVAKETLSPADKMGIQSIVKTVTSIPNFKVVMPSQPISQQDIYNIVSMVCVQTKDALVLLTALDIKNKIHDVALVTRDERLLVRSKVKITSAHPSEYIHKCPSDCLTRASCRHRK
jgi:hypothetical protein